MPQERRKYPRIKPSAEYTLACCNADFAAQPGQRSNLALKFIDMSPKGAMIVTVGRLREGVNLHVEIVNPGTGARFTATAAVRWSQTWERSGKEAHVCGIEFMDASEIRGDEMRFFSPWVKNRTAFAAETAKREHARFVPASCSVECVKHGFLGWSSKNVGRRLLDLSEGGLQLDLMEKVEAGDRLRIKLEFKSPAMAVEAEGEARWSKRNTMILEPHFMTGIKFTKAAPEEQAKIRELTKLFVVLGGAKSVDEGPPVGLA